MEKALRGEAAMPTMEAWLQERGLGENETETASYPRSEAEGIICSFVKTSRLYGSGAGNSQTGMRKRCGMKRLCRLRRHGRGDVEGMKTKKETASYPWSKAEWIICSLRKPASRQSGLDVRNKQAGIKTSVAATGLQNKVFFIRI